MYILLQTTTARYVYVLVCTWIYVCILTEMKKQNWWVVWSGQSVCVFFYFLRPANRGVGDKHITGSLSWET